MAAATDLLWSAPPPAAPAMSPPTTADARSKAAQEARKQTEEDFKKWMARQDEPTAAPAHLDAADLAASGDAAFKSMMARVMEGASAGGLLGLQDDIAVNFKEQVLSEISAKERKWAQEREDELRSIEAARQCLEQREKKVRTAEAEREDLLLRLDDDIKRRSLATEEARRRTTQALEARLRRELHAELEPKIRIAVERELTERITDEIQTKFQREFEIMCQTMKEELEKARQQMEAEIEQQLTGKVEARMLPLLRAQADKEVHEGMAAHVKDTLRSAEKMRMEYKIVVEQRDALEKELKVVQSVHTQDTLQLNEALQGEQARHKGLEAEVQAAKEALRSFEEERALYPLLQEVAKNRTPWLGVNEELNELRRENSKLQADAEFSARELEMLRAQLAKVTGGTPGARGEEDPESLYAAAKGGQGLLMKNRFRYTPKKEVDAPTFPFNKEDRERIFFAEMELLKQATTKEQQQRRQRNDAGKRSSSRRR